jgi:hypothetical protein
MAAMGQKETQVTALCEELQISRQTLYRHVDPQWSTSTRWREAPESQGWLNGRN